MTDPLPSPHGPGRPQTTLQRFGIAFGVAFALAFGLRALVGGVPSVLTAPEVDALEGGVVLAETMTGPRLEGGTKAMLRAGFAVPLGHPRAAGIANDDEVRRSATLPPIPRWLAAFGVSVLPGPDAMPNASRAGVAATLVGALILLMLLLHFGLARGLALCLLLGTIPEARDAFVGYGYGVSALFGATLTLIGFDRLASRAPTTRLSGSGMAIAVIGGLTLMLGTHPFMVFALLAVFFVLPLAGRADNATGPTTADEEASRGLIRLPTVPLSLVLWPIAAIVGLVAVWPTLWAGTGKRLMAYLLQTGFYQSPPHASLSAFVDPGGDRSGQAIAALVQSIAWLPLPLLALAVIGGLSRRRQTAAAVPLLAAVLLGGLLDGSLNGGRLSLWPFVWAPVLWLAVAGLETVMARLHPSVGLGGLRGPLGRLALPAVALASLIELTGLRATAKARTAVELDYGIPMTLVAEGHDLNPTTFQAQITPGLNAIADHFEWGVGFAPDGWTFTQGNSRPEDGDYVFTGIYSQIAPR